MKKAISIALVILVITVCACTMFACGSKSDYKIGVQAGTTGEFYVKGDADMLFDGFSNVDCVTYDNGALAAKALIDGQIDYVIIDNEPAKKLVAENSSLKLIDIALTTEQYAFGVDKNQPELLASVNEIIAEIKADGTLDAIFAKYDNLLYDDEGGVVGGEDGIVGIQSATYDSNKNQLVVATNAEFAPYEYMKGDLYAGIDIEIAKLIADELGLELVISNMEFDAVVMSVGVNGVDIAMAGLTVTATRKQSVNFTDPYYEGAYQVLIVKADDTRFDNCNTKADVEALLKTK